MVKELINSSIFTLFFLFFSTIFYSQDVIKGIVLNGLNQPISKVRVYINESQLSTETNADGSFLIESSQLPNTNIVIVKEAYSTVYLPVKDYKNKYLKIILEKEKTIEEVVLYPFQDQLFYQYFGFFMDNIITQQNGSTIKNIRDVQFSYNKKDKILKARAKKPLIIINEKMGYEIIYDMIDFSFDFDKKKRFFIGSTQYKELKMGKNKLKKCMLNRLENYQGSLQHFVRSAYLGQLKKDNFVVNEMKFVPNPNYPSDKELATLKTYFQLSSTKMIEIPSDLKSIMTRKAENSPTATVITKMNTNVNYLIKTKENQKWLVVNDLLDVKYWGYHYQWDNNELVITDQPMRKNAYFALENQVEVELLPNGNYNPPDAIVTYNDWAKTKLDNTLPLDYNPEEWKNHPKLKN